jgi:hypothetical protein
MPTAVFRFTMSFFPVATLPVSSLRFTVVLASPSYTAFITTIGLPPEASTTNAENKMTPATLNLE